MLIESRDSHHPYSTYDDTAERDTIGITRTSFDSLLTSVRKSRMCHIICKEFFTYGFA